MDSKQTWIFNNLNFLEIIYDHKKYISLIMRIIENIFGNFKKMRMCDVY